MRDARRLASAWALSLLAHGAVVGAGALLVATSLSARAPAVPFARTAPWGADTVDIELPTMVSGSIDHGAGDSATEATPVPRGGGEGTPRPDMGADGRGGTDTSEKPALNLADRDDGTRLSRDVQSRFDRDQLQRIKSAAERASREDMRASREPMELTFLATGSGDRPERRTSSELDPSAGALGTLTARRGGALGAIALPLGFGEPRRDPGGSIDGGPSSAPGAGVRDGVVGRDHRDSARTALGRPLVDVGTPSVPANAQGKPSDTLDSEQEVASMVQSLVHASTAGGRQGPGPGGQNGPGATGSGGVAGPGSRSNALGTGGGGLADNDPRDKRRTDYIRKMQSKVHPLWAKAFPRWALAEGMQGTVIVSFVIQSDGSVSGARVTRPSGIAEFDENCRQAVVRASPFGPLPPELGPQLRYSLSFDSKNPAVRPPGPGSSSSGSSASP